jgi:hypothetical protein
MNNTVTEEESRLLRAVGFGDYMIDVSYVSDEFYQDLIELCRKHVEKDKAE